MAEVFGVLEQPEVLAHASEETAQLKVLLFKPKDPSLTLITYIKKVYAFNHSAGDKRIPGDYWEAIIAKLMIPQSY